MKIIKELLDSQAFGASVLKIIDIETQIDFSQFEADYLNQYDPRYVYARLEIEALDKIHYLEDHGFRFMETQFKMTKRLTRLENMKPFDNHFFLEKVTNERELPQIYTMCDQIMKVDRIFIDQQINPEIARQRYYLYIEKSFKAENENLFKTIYQPAGQTIGFHTNMLIDKKNVLFFIGGILPEFRNSGASFAHEYLIFNYLFNQGFKNITTHISAANYNIINFEMRTVGFKPKQTYVVLRKIY